MRFMLIVKAVRNSEAGRAPSPEMLAARAAYDEELIRAGVLLAGEGLTPGARGVRVRFEGRRRVVVDGPYAEAKELVTGFWLIQVKSLDEAIEWTKRVPLQASEIEIRQVHEAGYFQSSTQEQGETTCAS